MAESGAFSARRPRDTLAPVSHNVSAIPMPSSAMKRSNSTSNFHNNQAPYTGSRVRSTSGSRMSMAPPGRPNQPQFQRTSSGSNLAELNTVQRPSFGGNNMMASTTGGRKSFMPAGLQTPANPIQLAGSTQRRSSVYSARQSSSMAQVAHQSFFTQAPIPAGVPRDPRPLKDRSYQALIGQELMDYLTQNNFEMDMKHSLTHNTMRSPTQKDFNYMFQWLYHRIDPSYRFQKNMDTEVPPILKQLRYPFERSITKSQIAAVGGNNWFTFLGMLHWMMQLAKMMDQFNSGAHDEACVEAGHDISGDRIIFDFLSGAYHAWLAMEDDQDEDVVLKPHVDAMAAKFDEANSKYIEQVEALEADHKSLQDQIDELGKTGPKLSKLDEQIKILEEDKIKFETWNENMQAKTEKYEGRIKLLNDEIEKIENELKVADDEKAELQRAVDRQGISISDIDRMNTEHERLQKNMQTTSIRLEESKKKVSDKENEAGQKLEELEKTVEEYNSKGYQIGIIGPSADSSKGQYEIKLSINQRQDFRSSRQNLPDSEPERLLADSANGYQPQHLLNLDVRGAVKNGIVSFRKEVNQRRNAAAEADMGISDTLQQAREAMDDKQQEIDGLEYRLRAAEQEFEKTRENITAQKLTSDAQIERLEKELSRMRTQLTESIQHMEQREMNTNIEYEQLTLRAAQLREELHTEVEKMLNDIIKFKVHVQKSLEDYEVFVGEEVERECVEHEEAMATGEITSDIKDDAAEASQQ